MKEDTKGDIDSNTEYTERAYQTSEVATMLDIAVPTVRKYSQTLESQGYTFLKGKGTGQHQARLYLEKDVMALRYLKEIREKSGITVEKATNIVVQQFGTRENRAIQPVRSSDIQYNGDRRYNELKELMQQQNELIKGLTERLDQQQEYIDNRLNERDKVLMQSLKEVLETKKQIAAAEEKPEEKKGLFRRLFGKS